MKHWFLPVKFKSYNARDRQKHLTLPRPINLSQPGPQSGPSWEHPEGRTAPGQGPGGAPRLDDVRLLGVAAAALAGRRQAHLLLQLVLVALPGQLVLVLGPLGEGGGGVSMLRGRSRWAGTPRPGPPLDCRLGAGV